MGGVKRGNLAAPCLESTCSTAPTKENLWILKSGSPVQLFSLHALPFFGCSLPSALSHFNHREISGGDSTTFYKKAAGGKTLRLANLVTGVTSRRRLSYMSMASKLIFLGLLQLLSVVDCSNARSS